MGIRTKYGNSVNVDTAQFESRVTTAESNILNHSASLAEMVNKFGSTSNLFDKTKVTPNGYINGSGGITTYGVGGVSDYIPVSAGDVITYVAIGNDGTSVFDYSAWYNEDKSFSSMIINTTNTINTVSAPIDGYFRLSYGNDVIDKIKVVKSATLNELKTIQLYLDIATRFYGKKISFLGDSITAGYGLTYQEQRYSTIVCNTLGAIEDNQGSSGTHIAQQEGVGGAFIDRYTGLSIDSELIVVMGGINDYYLGTGVMGAVDSTDSTTFYGAINNLITSLQNRYPAKDIIFVTPFQSNSNVSGHNTDVANTYSSQPLKGYRDAIISRCLVYGIPVLDLYSVIGFDLAHNANHVNKFSQDGIHPNRLGNQRIADRLIAFIKSL